MMFKVRILQREPPPSRVSSRALIRAVVVSTWAIAFLCACTAIQTEAGIMVQEGANGAPRWIASSRGIPVWSPVDDRIAWGTEDGLFVTDDSEDPPQSIVDTSVAGRPAWSPDGTRLAYVDRQNTSLVILDSTTGDVESSISLATPDEDRAPKWISMFGGPAWSPEGNQISFTCWDGEGDEVCVFDADNGAIRQVTNLGPATNDRQDRADSGSPAGSNVGPSTWSPDGKSLAVAAYPDQSGSASGVFVIDVTAGRARRLSGLRPNSEIHWINDGNAVMFSAIEEGRSEVLQIGVTDLAVKRLTSELAGNSRDPVMSPDGKLLAVASDGAIVVIGSGNQGSTMIPGVTLRHPSWNSAGDQIAFTAEGDHIQKYSE
jgi:Tol biopolymer transport system component